MVQRSLEDPGNHPPSVPQTQRNGESAPTDETETPSSPLIRNGPGEQYGTFDDLQNETKWD